MAKTNYKKTPLYLLIEIAQKDNIEALEELIRRIQKDIFGIYTHICKKREIASDLTQEALVKIAKNLEKLHDTKSFKTWSNRIALNVFYDFIKKDSRHTPPVSIDDIEVEDKHTEPMDKCLASELGCLIKNSILSLPMNSRIAIVLREFEGMSYEDIANLTHTSIGTVKSRISRARLKLQEELSDYL